MSKNHLITGIPRSGTTLLTSTLSTSPQAITFSEPEWLKAIRVKSDDSTHFTENLIQQITELRELVKNQQPIQLKSSRFHTGQPSNYYIRDNQGKIISDKSESTVQLDPLLYDASFIIKSNAQFTACLKQLLETEYFKLHCVVRNPVAVVMSWRSLDIPVSQGNMKIAEKYSSDYLSYIEPAKTLLEKQVLMADWFFSQYRQYNHLINVIKYEHLISHMQQIINQQFSIYDTVLAETNNQNKSRHYDLSESNEIKACFQDMGKSYKYFYPSL